MEKKNVIRIVISIICSVLLLVGGTYAAWNFLTEKTDINMFVDGDQITFNAGTDITVEHMLPVYSMYSETNVITRDIEIYKENGDYTAGINLYLNLKAWNSALSSASFRWALYKNGNYLNSGSFSGTSQGNNVLLTSVTQKINTVENKDTYKLYMWIDAYQESSINMMNQSFTVSLYGQATFYKDTDDDVFFDMSEPNAPELADGMIPIKYNYVIDEWVKADSTNANNDWYDYYNKMWANAVMVTSDSRNEYMTADVGTTVNEDDILAYYVWIPRYRYILFNVDFAVADNPQEIQIEFQSIDDVISNGTQNDEYLTHPAFWWDNNSNGLREDGEEISGFWAGKFVTVSSNAGIPCIIPNSSHIYMAGLSNLFNFNRNFQSTTYLTEIGVTEVDAHAIKNIEWGAIAYLSHSKYGKNRAVTHQKTYITGEMPNYTYNDFIIVDGLITKDKEPGKGVGASTTGNVYGIYDMVGIRGTHVMAFMLKQDGTICDGLNIESKYYDLYEYNAGDSANYSNTKLGDAMGETAGWYGDDHIAIGHEGYCKIGRGGTYWSGDGAGGIFFFHGGYTGAANPWGSRSILVLP